MYNFVVAIDTFRVMSCHTTVSVVVSLCMCYLVVHVSITIDDLETELCRIF